MLTKLHHSLQKHHVALYALTLVVVLMLFMLEPLNCYLAWSLLYGYGLYLFVLLMAFYLYFRGLSDGPEIALAIAFVLWHALSRILNGDVALQQEGYLVMKGPLMVCMLSLGSVLSRAQRRKLLYGVGLASGVFFTLLAVMDLYSFVTRRTLYYALTQVETGIPHGFRMQILGYNPNTVAFWYLLSIAFLMLIFLDCRRKTWRIPLAIVLIIHYLTMASAYSRNAELAFSMEAGLLAALLLAEKLPRRRGKAGRAALLVLTTLLVGMICFKGFAFGTNLLGQIHNRLSATTATGQVETAADTTSPGQTEAAAGQETEADIYRDSRELTDDSERLMIYKTLPAVFRQEPLRLLRGCLYGERMGITNALIHKTKTMMHDTWLEILNYMGIPGLLILLAFTVYVLRDCVKLYFSVSPQHTPAIKFLALPVLAGFSFSVFESFLWFRTDFMTLSCYLFMGFVIAESRETRTRRNAP